VLKLIESARDAHLDILETDAFRLRNRLQKFKSSTEKAMMGGTMVRIVPED